MSQGQHWDWEQFPYKPTHRGLREAYFRGSTQELWLQFYYLQNYLFQDFTWEEWIQLKFASRPATVFNTIFRDHYTPDGDRSYLKNSWLPNWEDSFTCPPH